MPTPPNGGSGERGRPDHDLPEELLEGWLLVHVAREPIHGYALAKQLEDIPEPVPHQTTIYRHLASLEERGLLDSEWEIRSSAPPVRTYRLTERGKRHMRAVYARVSRLERACRAFLKEASKHI